MARSSVSISSVGPAAFEAAGAATAGRLGQQAAVGRRLQLVGLWPYEPQKLQ
jgi:hypothetical protein